MKLDFLINKSMNQSAQIYDQQFNLSLQRTGTTTRTLPQPWGSIKIIKHITNNIQFYLLNYNKIPYKLTNKTLTATFLNKNTDDIILQKKLSIKNSQDGITELRVNANETELFQDMYCRMFINYTNEEGERLAVYKDENFNIIFEVEIIHNQAPKIQRSHILTENMWIRNDNILFSRIGYKTTTLTINHKLKQIGSFSIYRNKPISGQIILQGALEETQVAPGDNAWFNIPIIVPSTNPTELPYLKVNDTLLTETTERGDTILRTAQGLSSVKLGVTSTVGATSALFLGNVQKGTGAVYITANYQQIIIPDDATKISATIDRKQISAERTTTGILVTIFGRGFETITISVSQAVKGTIIQHNRNPNYDENNNFTSAINYYNYRGKYRLIRFIYLPGSFNTNGEFTADSIQVDIPPTRATPTKIILR